MTLRARIISRILRLSPGDRVIPMQPADSARPLGSRPPDPAPEGSIRCVRSRRQPQHVRIDPISKKILRPPESFFSKANRDLEGGGPGFRGPPLPQDLQSCGILLVEPVQKRGERSVGIRGSGNQYCMQTIEKRLPCDRPVVSLQYQNSSGYLSFRSDLIRALRVIRGSEN
jgi:hypothetical protein